MEKVPGCSPSDMAWRHVIAMCNSAITVLSCKANLAHRQYLLELATPGRTVHKRTLGSAGGRLLLFLSSVTLLGQSLSYLSVPVVSLCICDPWFCNCRLLSCRCLAAPLLLSHSSLLTQLATRCSGDSDPCGWHPRHLLPQSGRVAGRLARQLH